jgi:hypothetical protein
MAGQPDFFAPYAESPPKEEPMARWVPPTDSPVEEIARYCIADAGPPCSTKGCACISPGLSGEDYARSGEVLTSCFVFILS